MAFRLDVLDDLPGECEGFLLLLGRWTLGDDLRLFLAWGWLVPGLSQKAPGDAPYDQV